MPAAPQLVRQSYGIAMAQCVYGGPRGIWLECTTCSESQKIAGSTSAAWMAKSDAEVAAVFRQHGWTGKGSRMLKARCPKARCPKCSKRRAA